jgi:hypothetical protein
MAHTKYTLLYVHSETPLLRLTTMLGVDGEDDVTDERAATPPVPYQSPIDARLFHLTEA